ncbi:hypothetical protein [Pseudomonas sp.]|jgi:hypothetical protein|uniref:hypothetical protein n=1 Tax=Pseudomonas sp. TaxID=306 RepID=UPI00299D293A|nr:hypothetical protein [Pseudomonas sp.]MDX1367798.1 hypothetical protein [Pseudomonas sp.]MDX1722706.1 hypothetical protein [Pseudomonas sp.]
MDYFIIASLTCAGLYFHWWLFVRIKRWADRDLALSLAGKDAAKKDYMLQRLAEAQASKVKRRELQAWLERAAADYRAP